MNKFYLSGLLYDWVLEPVLRSTKRHVAKYIFQHDLFPVLDLCCGTGKQCRWIGESGQFTSGLDSDFRMMDYASHKYPHIPFICGDAAHVPMRDNYFNGIILSYALHDKSPGMRIKILNEVRRLLAPKGRILIVDFEKPWNRRSRIGGIFANIIERTAGKEHYKNGKQFLEEGGLKTFMVQNGLVEVGRHNIELGSSSIVAAKFSGRI